MEKKYNLALIPLSKSDEVIALAKKLAAFAGQYLLGEKSLPHVTLYQFYIEENEIDQVWKQICMTWEEKSIELKLNKFSIKMSDEHAFWVSLLPNHGDDLYKMHVKIANSLQLPIKDTFDPHMTLISSKNNVDKKEVEWVADSYQPIIDTFILSLGSSDENGQLTEIIYRYEVK